MEYKKYHFFRVDFTVGKHKDPSKKNAEIGKSYGLTCKAEDLVEIQAHLEKVFDAKDLIIKPIIQDVCSLTDAEKAALVIDRL